MNSSLIGDINRGFLPCLVWFDLFVCLFWLNQPDLPDEKERIEAAGGRVINWNGNRVLGVLATSRSIGTYALLY